MRARPDALERELSLPSPAPEPEPAPPTPANGGLLDSASQVSVKVFKSPSSSSVPGGGSSMLLCLVVPQPPGSPSRTAHGRQGHQPQAFRPQRQLSTALSARWLLFHVFWLVSLSFC
jgi:hypothetical protein